MDRRIVVVVAGALLVLALLGLFMRGLEVEEAYALYTGRAIGVYVTVVNMGLESHCIVGARIGEDAPGVKAEIHETIEENGVYRMKPVDEICLGPLERLEMRQGPGSYHVMIMGGDLEGIVDDGVVVVYLILDDGSEIRVEAPLRTS